MRNFLMEADIDGRASLVSGGPRAKDGGMHISIRQRDEGASVTAFSISCFVDCDGMLNTFVYNCKGHCIARFSTER